jgi:cytochrome c556
MKISSLALATIATIACTSASAQPKAEDVIYYRQAAMTMMGWNLGPLAAMVKGKTPWDAKQFAVHADRLAGLAPQIIEGFAKGSDKGATTDAKADIWANFDDFTAKDKNLIEQTRALAQVAHAGDEAAMKEQFKKTAGACKECHKKYKAD